jgi:hypothetical protein
MYGMFRETGFLDKRASRWAEADILAYLSHPLDVRCDLSDQLVWVLVFGDP